MKISDLVNVIDVEATCWEPPSSKPANEISEIIEIGIAVVDTKSLSILENHNIIVRPSKSSVSTFCTQLTTLTKYEINCGYDFPLALSMLESSFSPKERLFVSWGDYDKNMFESNCLAYGCKYPFGPRHLNLRNCFSTFHGLNKELDIKEAGQLVGLPFKGTLHRGMDDAINIANLFISMLTKFRK